MQQNDESNEPENPFAFPQSSSIESKTVASKDSEARELRPLKTIWTRPRDTVRRVVAKNPELHMVLLAGLAGIGKVLDRASTSDAGDEMPTEAIIGAACAFGPLGGLLSLWIGSHLIRLTGTWVGGTGAREHIKTAIVWASVPAVFALLLWIPQILLFGSDMFTEETPRIDAQPMLFSAIALTELVLGIWGFVLLCNTIAEVQGYRSAWRGLGNLFLAGAVIMVPLLVIAFSVPSLLQD